MNEKVKEILDRFDKKLKNYELDKKFGQLSTDSICHLFPSEIIAIKDYITSLQEKEIDKNFIKECGFNNVQQMALELSCLQEENERLKKEQLNLKSELANMWECKARNDEAIDFVKKESKKCYSNRTTDNSAKVIGNFMWHTDKLLNILNGGDVE